MKKSLISILLLLTLIASAALLCSCLDIYEEPEEEEEEEQTVQKKLYFDGEKYTVFSEKRENSFDIVYPDSKGTMFAMLAIGIRDLVSEQGISEPRIYKDSEKEEAKLELLIGNTDRALSAEAKALLDEKTEEEPDALHWVWLYRDGQLALYANSKVAYEFGITDLTTKYFDGERFEVLGDTQDATLKFLLPECIPEESFESDIIIPMVNTCESRILATLKDESILPTFDYLDANGRIPDENRDEYGTVDVRKLRDYLQSLRTLAESYCARDSLSETNELIASAITLSAVNYSIKNPIRYDINTEIGEAILSRMYEDYPITREGKTVYALDRNLPLPKLISERLRLLCPEYSEAMMLEAEKACGIR